LIAFSLTLPKIQPKIYRAGDKQTNYYTTKAAYVNAYGLQIYMNVLGFNVAHPNPILPNV